MANEKDRPRIVVIGAGAVGGFYGAIAHRAGAHVALVLRSDVETVRQHGLIVDSPLGDLSFAPAAVHGPDDEPVPGADYVVCCVKVLPTVDRASLIAPWVGPDTTVVLIENGIDIEPEIASALPDHELLSGLAFVGVSRLGPGRIRHQAFGRLTLGAWPAGTTPALSALAALFETGGIDVKISETIVRERWAKSLWNAPFNPISVLADGTDTDTMLGVPGGEALVRGVMAEVAAVAAADGHPMPDDAAERNIAATRQMTAYRNSMALDHRAGRPLEIDAILGNIVDIAARLDVPVPRLAGLRALVAMKTREAERAATGS
ncbi:ketopantoate reductase family protein [Salinisphaera sp. Q1T1-3]|uniref:ketopantoate reductase family protein n=1 Tax=Salinisphaera sp. Q1T1-3 TaxID=2321229 RepID=UPI000E74EA65|nr:2-dehydropantoate 2-reductase [Salinisphaera sp. Q1T1-3]RJS91440.1 2-dehydropantoate 2-reductase [Salinisphaera sp. Q1T1-3]